MRKRELINETQYFFILKLFFKNDLNEIENEYSRGGRTRKQKQKNKMRMI